jgi:Tfp pilus assembly protein PilN
MNTSRIDFASPRRHRLAQAASIVGAVALLLVCAGGVLLERRAAESAERLRQDESAPETTQPRRADAEMTARDGQQQAVDRAIRQLSLPWLSLLAALESGTPDSIHLLTLQLNPDAHKLYLTAQADSIDTMLSYVQSLQRQAGFGLATPLRHEVRSRDGTSVIHFSIELGLSDDKAGATATKAPL